MIKRLFSKLREKRASDRREVHGLLDKAYGDPNLRFRASNILMIINVALIILVMLLGIFAIASPTIIDPSAKFAFSPIFGLIIALFMFCRRFVLEGKLKLARRIVMSAAIVAVIGAITITGGFPKSIASSAIIIPVMISYCLYGGKTSHATSAMLILFSLAQWLTISFLGLTLPDFTSNAEPLTNAAISITTCLAIASFVLGVFDHSNRKYIRRADAAMVSKTNFLANTSHEIRTPMNGIIGLSEVMMRTTKLDQDQKIYMDAIHKSGRALMTVINDILDFSRLDAGHVELQNESFNLYTLTHELRTLMTIQAADNNVIIKCDYPEDMPQKYMGDAGRIRQILINLMANAMKFTENGHVLIKVRPAAKQGVLIDIEDTGIGIARDKLERIFERFTQADQGTTQKYGGTGLGLSISQRLVELMGGQIGVRSEEGKGSVFSINLPLAIETKDAAMDALRVDPLTAAQKLVVSPAQSRESSNVHPLPAGTGRQILMVSRNPETIEEYGSKLRAWGMRVFFTDKVNDLKQWIETREENEKHLPIILLDGDLAAAELSGLNMLILDSDKPLQSIGIIPKTSAKDNSVFTRMPLKIAKPADLKAYIENSPLTRIRPA